VALYAPGARGVWGLVRDVNGDGRIDARDGQGVPLKTTAGAPVERAVYHRWMYVEPTGDIRAATEQRWVFRGLDPQKRPVYAFPPEPAFAFRSPELPSPYTPGVSNPVRDCSETVTLPDGGLLASFMALKGSPLGMGLSNSGGVDVARFRPDGRLRWYRPLNEFGPVQGVKYAPGLLLSSHGHQGEWLGLDADGLGLGRVGFPPEARWLGYWVDHPDHYALFQGNDGGLHVLVGDYMINAQHWLTLARDPLRRRKVVPVTLGPERARALASGRFEPPALTPRPSPPRVVVRKLPGPLAVDGDPAKWRALGVAPQFVITPVTAHGSVDGAADLSGAVRLGYHDKDIYVHVTRFDDTATFHQPVENGHLQDTLEVMFNGFQDGFQWNVARYADAGEAVVRRRFFFQNLTRVLPRDVAPCAVRVLDDARDLPERALVESATGEDLSTARAVLYEFRLPVDARAYEGATDAIFPVGPGRGFWLGVMLSDNDTPGADVQDFAVWPPSFGTFEPKERGAWAEFER
jgi:hypothetical protein